MYQGFNKCWHVHTRTLIKHDPWPSNAIYTFPYRISFHPHTNPTGRYNPLLTGEKTARKPGSLSAPLDEQCPVSQAREGPGRGAQCGAELPRVDYISQEELPAVLQLRDFKGIALKGAEGVSPSALQKTALR